jgi:shikimate kinase
MTGKTNIALIGPPGAGKSALGGILAHKLGMGLFDIDLEIERHMNMSISQIFATFGEDFFRSLEHEFGKKIALLEGHVIATGGGFPVNPQNQATLKQNCSIIYLEASAKTLQKRLKNDNTRPLLANPAQIQTILTGREPIYRQLADFIIYTDSKDLEGCLIELIHIFTGKTCQNRAIGEGEAQGVADFWGFGAGYVEN